MGRTVLVTGAARHLGGRMARVLSSETTFDRVIGVDVVPPRQDLGGAEFIRADIRNPVIAKIINAADVDTVVHMGVIATPMQAGGRATMKDINVIGTMQLLAACQKSTSVRRLIVKSTASVYGSGPRDPAMFTEDTAPQHPPTSGWAKDSVEVEGYVRGFARRCPDVAVSILRFANIIGPDIDTPMTSYFSLPVIPTVLGYDARLQFVHEDDQLEITRIVAIADDPVTGVYNIAGPGVLSLSQAVRRLGRPSVALPRTLLGAAGRSLGSTGLADFSTEQVRFLTYGRAIDTSRVEQELGFAASWTTADAFADFARGHNVNPLITPEVLVEAQQRLSAALGGAGRVIPSGLRVASHA
ncbi:MAG: NAD-dependent epimerase/dehydratase family protein [Candidatus Nanopelagicales bacterium]